MQDRDLHTPAATGRIATGFAAFRPGSLDRRSLLVGLAMAGGLLGARGAAAQAETLVGYLLHCDPNDFYAVNHFHVGPFRQRMCALGWCAAREARVIVRAGATADALARSAMELVGADVAVIVAAGGTASTAARQATSTIPIVFTYANGPVGRRLVASLSRPEGNITGFALMDETMAKLIEFAREAFPGARAVAYLLDPTNSPADALAQQAAENAALASRAGLGYREFPVRNWPEIETAIAAAKGGGADALIVESSTLFLVHRFLIAETALRQHLPLLARAAQFGTAGALISYGEDVADMQARAAGYVDRILRGARVSDLPVQQAAMLQLIINARTARRLAVAIPSSITTLADEIVDFVVQ